MDFTFLLILKESIKLLFKNGKLMLLTITLSLFLSSTLFLIFDFSAFSLMRDMLIKESLFPISSTNSSEFASHLAGIKENFPLLLTVYVAFVLLYLIVTFLSTIATIIVSHEAHNDKNLSLKELCVTILKSWKRLLITGFYTTILVIGYTFFVISLAAPLLMSSDISILGIAIPFSIVAYVFYLYMSSVWIMGLVVSVVEDIYGMEALGKAAAILKTLRMNGFVLNILFNMVSLGVYMCSRLIKGGRFGVSGEKICGLFVVNCSCLVKIFTFTAYVVLYNCQGKNSEGIELHHSKLEYEKLSIALVNGLPL